MQRLDGGLAVCERHLDVGELVTRLLELLFKFSRFAHSLRRGVTLRSVHRLSAFNFTQLIVHLLELPTEVFRHTIARRQRLLVEIVSVANGFIFCLFEGARSLLCLEEFVVQSRQSFTELLLVGDGIIPHALERRLGCVFFRIDELFPIFRIHFGLVRLGDGGGEFLFDFLRRGCHRLESRNLRLEG